MSESDEKKFRLALSPAALNAINELRVLLGNVSIENAVRTSIGTELVIRRHMAKGWNVLIQKDGYYKALSWPDVT